jgi:hypothetical protein
LRVELFRKVVSALITSLLFALCVTFWTYVFNSMFAGKKLGGYLVVPVIVTSTQFVGGVSQYYFIGPSLVRYSLQDVGWVANVGLGMALSGILLWWTLMRRSAPPQDAAARQFIRVLPWCCAIATLVTCFIEVRLTLSPEKLVAQGYSGRLDVADLVAYILGFALILVNHWVMRARVLSTLTPTS